MSPTRGEGRRGGGGGRGGRGERGQGESDRNELCRPLAGKGKGCTQKGHLSRAHSEVGRRGGGKE